MQYFGLLIPLILVIAALVILKIYQDKNRQYLDFVIQHSTAIKELNRLNNQYRFAPVGDGNIVHQYDNEIFYDSISTQDYLTYWLVFNQKKVHTDIQNAKKNRNLFNEYIHQVNSCEFNNYDTPSIPKNTKKLLALEKKIFDSKIAHPVTNFRIHVQLYLSKINGRIVALKHDHFSPEMIEHIIQKLNQKRGDYYLDNSIWQAICRVERGRVSNKMRFAIYQRDGHRCRKCGRQTSDLEVDHIFPISKGGKSTMDNLQTLCHRCNVAKSNTIEAGVVNPASKRQSTNIFCAHCGAPMVKRSGPRGSFYGCSNYPKCTFTIQIK